MKKNVLFMVMLLMAAFGARAEVIHLETLSGPDFMAKDGDILTGTLVNNVKIYMERNATVTLDGVTINGVDNSDCNYAGISCTYGQGGTIILKGTNNVRGFYRNNPGIYILEDCTLNIMGDGTLNASSNGAGAGIGGRYNGNCGNIIIHSGTINAVGGTYAAGIGSARYGTTGGIYIRGGNVKANGGTYAPGIGAGTDGSCRDVVAIAENFLRVEAIKGAFSPCSIGHGMDAVNNWGVTLGCGIDYNYFDGGQFYPDGITESPFVYEPLKEVAAKDGDILAGDLSNCRITIADNATVTLHNATISAGFFNGEYWAGITCSGNAKLILSGESTVNSVFWGIPGIYVPKDKTLIIKGSGSLDVTGGNLAAAIGGGNELDCGNITIENTVTRITATAGYDAPCSVGRGNDGTQGTIIVGGVIYPEGVTENPFVYEGNPEDGIGDIWSDKNSGNKGDCVKVIHNGKLLIDCNGKTYDILGEEFGVKNEE